MTVLPREPNFIAAPAPGMYVGKAAILEFNNFIFNDRRVVDMINITKITGIGDPDIEISSEPNPDRDGETPLDALYRGRTLTLSGYIRAGSFNRLEQVWALFKDAFDVLVESPLVFRWLDWKDYFIDSQALVDWGYDAGSGTVASSSTGLAPTSTVNKQLNLAPNGSASITPAAGAVYSYGDAEHIVGCNHAVMTGVVVGPRFRRTSANQYLRVVYEHANTRLALYKVVAGVSTLLDSVTVTLTAGTTYYIVARAEGNLITYSVWSALPTDFGTPLATDTYTLAGGDATTFATGNTGYRSGIFWTPNSTSDRITLFDLGALGPGDAQIYCRKGAAGDPEDDVYEGGEYRRPIMITLRASDPRFVSRKAAIFSAVPTTFAITFPGGGGGVTFPADGSGLVFGGALGTAINLGRSVAFPIVRMYGGPMPNPVVSNPRNNTRVGINGTIANGDYLEFDTYRRTVKDSAGVNRYDLLTDNTNWLRLEKGSNPLIVGADSVAGSARIDLIYRHSSR